MFDVHEGVKFDGVSREGWASHLFQKYREQISADIQAFSREQMVQQWLDDAPLENQGQIMDLDEYERLQVSEQLKAKPARKKRNNNRHICESNILPGSVGISRRFTRQMGRS